MNRALRLESLIRRDHKNSMTLQRILEFIDWHRDGLDDESKKWMGLRHRFTAATSELRADLESRTPMETLLWTKGKTPGEGVYSIVPARVEGGVVVVAKQLDIFTCGGDDLVSKLEMGGID